MAPKRPTPLDDPPSASSSEEEEESEEVSDEEDTKSNQKQKNGGKAVDSEDEGNEEEEEEEEESEDEEETRAVPPPVEKKPPVKKPTPQSPSLLGSEDEEGSESEFDSQVAPSPSASDFTIKAIVSKAIDDPTTTKKPAAKTSTATPMAATPMKSSSKRPAESKENGKESPKKKGKMLHGEEKSASNRLWSEDDEIVILKGMIDYHLKKGADPHADTGAFHEFIKKLLHVDVSKGQLMDKIRRLKKKYLNNAEKGENGEDPVFSKPHEHKSFELSKKIWGGGGKANVVDESAKSSSKKQRKNAKAENPQPSPEENGKELLSNEALPVEVKAGQEDFWATHPRLEESLQSEKSAYLSFPEPGKLFLKENMSLIGSSKAKELEQKWKNLKVDEIELYLKKVDLIREQTHLMLEVMKSSKF